MEGRGHRGGVATGGCGIGCVLGGYWGWLSKLKDKWSRDWSKKNVSNFIIDYNIDHRSVGINFSPEINLVQLIWDCPSHFCWPYVCILGFKWSNIFWVTLISISRTHFLYASVRSSLSPIFRLIAADWLVVQSYNVPHMKGTFDSFRTRYSTFCWDNYKWSKSAI